jgi:hypothetical protein
VGLPRIVAARLHQKQLDPQRDVNDSNYGVGGSVIQFSR